MKKAFYLLGLVGLLFVWQGCTTIVEHEVTITFKNGQRVTLYFDYLDTVSSYDVDPFIALLEKLEAGKEVDINKPFKSRTTPLKEAINYALGFYNQGRERGDRNFYATRYLLEHGADPNVLPASIDYRDTPQMTATQYLCSSLVRRREVGTREAGIKGMALFLSYGARLGIKNTDGRTAINYLEKYEPWISGELREQYEEKPDPSQEGKSKPLHEEKKPPAPPAWKSAIPQERQKALKKAYFTDIAEALQKLPQYRDAVDKAFLNYIKEAGVEEELVSALSAKTVF